MQHLRTIVTLVLLLTSCLIHGVGGAESIRLDSLQQQLAVAESDTSRLRIQVEIADHLIFVDPDSSKRFCDLALVIAEQASDTVRLAKIHNLLGIRSYVQSHYIDAIESFQESYQLSLACGDDHGANRAINNIGVMYATMEEHEASIQHYKEAHALSLRIKDYPTCALNLFNISGAYLALEQTDSSWYYLRKLEAFQRTHHTDQRYAPLKAMLYLETEQLDSAAFHAQLGLRELLRDEEQDLLQVCNVHITLSEVFRKQGDYPRALQELKQAESLASELQYSEVILSIYDQRAQIHEERGDFETAFTFQQEYLSLKDSLDTKNNFNRISELNARYEKEKREREYAEIQANMVERAARARQKDLIYLAIGILILILICIQAYHLRRKKRINYILNRQNAEIKTQRHKILSSMRYAKKIQRSILVPEDQIRAKLPETFIYLQPKDIVSGDFYWYEQLGERILLSTIDCTGHGVPGALMSLIAHNKLNKVVHELGITDPAEILSAVHHEIVDALHQKGAGESAQDGMDMSLCIIDEATRTIEFAGAQNPVFIVRDQDVLEFKGDSLYIGGSFSARMDVAFQFKTQTIAYEAGDQLYMFTDGFMDQFGGPQNKKLNKKRFQQILLECARDTVESTSGKLAAALDQWKGRNAQLDDILVLGTRLR